MFYTFPSIYQYALHQIQNFNKNIPPNELSINFELPTGFTFHYILTGTTIFIVVTFNQIPAKLLLVALPRWNTAFLALRTGIACE
jgi:hypothetical protein